MGNGLENPGSMELLGNQAELSAALCSTQTPEVTSSNASNELESKVDDLQVSFWFNNQNFEGKKGGGVIQSGGAAATFVRSVEFEAGCWLLERTLRSSCRP